MISQVNDVSIGMAIQSIVLMKAMIVLMYAICPFPTVLIVMTIKQSLWQLLIIGCQMFLVTKSLR